MKTERRSRASLEPVGEPGHHLRFGPREGFRDGGAEVDLRQRDVASESDVADDIGVAASTLRELYETTPRSSPFRSLSRSFVDLAVDTRLRYHHRQFRDIDRWVSSGIPSGAAAESLACDAD